MAYPTKRDTHPRILRIFELFPSFTAKVSQIHGSIDAADLLRCTLGVNGCRVKVFERIKELVTTTPCLALVDLADAKLVLQVNMDASKVAVGSVLLHVDG